jgi:integrase
LLQAFPICFNDLQQRAAIPCNMDATWRALRTCRGGVRFRGKAGIPSESLSNILQRGLQPAMVAAGIVTKKGKAKYTGLHSLRHFYASWCINRRVDGGLELPMKVVQERMGHSSIQITADRYSHLFPRGDDSAELAAAERTFLS